MPIEIKKFQREISLDADEVSEILREKIKEKDETCTVVYYLTRSEHDEDIIEFNGATITCEVIEEKESQIMNREVKNGKANKSHD